MKKILSFVLAVVIFSVSIVSFTAYANTEATSSNSTETIRSINFGKALKSKTIKLKTPKIKKIANGKVVFSSVKGATHYEIWDKQFIYYNKNYARVYKWKKFKTVKKTSCVLRDWEGRAYTSYVKVRAVRKKGNKKVYSKFSKVRSY